jgi:hypothetical protein
MTEVQATLLAVALRNVISEPNIEAGHERFVVLAGTDISYDAFCDAVAAALCDGLIYEPIWLPEGALQCHWHLELTSKGVAVARQYAQAAQC